MDSETQRKVAQRMVQTGITTALFLAVLVGLDEITAFLRRGREYRWRNRTALTGAAHAGQPGKR